MKRVTILIATFLLAVIPSVTEDKKPGKEVPLSEITALKLENLTLKMQQAQMTYEQLSNQREAVRADACKEAGIPPDSCAVDLQKKVLSETSNSNPPKEK